VTLTAGLTTVTETTDLDAAGCQYFDLAALPDMLDVRGREPGDRMQTVSGERRVKKLIGNAKLPLSTKQQLVLLCAGDDILWIPGVQRAVHGLLADLPTEAVVIRCMRT
jgi:tRNA(Ile)-lysidine synthetase-like protein